MSVVSASQFALARTRRSMLKAFRQKNWEAIKTCDRDLAANLNNAFDDSNRDTRALIDELEKIIGLYAEMVANLPADASDRASR